MALIDKASLLMVPSTYEDGTLYNVLPSGNKAPDETGSHNGYDQTRADFTFSRGSNLAATRVNADGLIEKGRENLLLNSNNFNNSWNQSGTTRTSGQSGYDGTNDAWKIERDGAAGLAFIHQTISTTGVHTQSIYAKANTEDWIYLQDTGTGGGNGYFDLVNGVAGTTTGIDASIDSVGNGWYRIQVVGNRTASGNIRVFVAKANGNLTVTGSIYIQDAQLEAGLVSTPYIETGATTATAGVLENTPRIDYSSGAGALLLEPQRTNFLPHSEYVEGNPLSNSPTITQNYAISPDGGKNAFRMQDVDANDFERFRYLGTESTLCMSLFVKKTTSAVSTYGGFGLNWSGGTSKNVYAAFDEYNGTIAIIGNDTGNAQVFVEDHDTYWRFALSATDTGSNTNVSANYYACISTNFTSPGLGLKDYTAYGAQLEAGSHVSSYIPTHGAAVTRGADSCSVTGVSDVIGSTTGSGYVEFTTYNHEDFGGIFEIINTSNPGQRLLIWMASTDNQIQLNNGAIAGHISKNNLSVGNHKAVFTYTTSKIKFFVDGEKVGEATPTSLSGGFNKVDFYHAQGGVFIQKKDISQAVLFDEELTEAEAIALTTL